MPPKNPKKPTKKKPTKKKAPKKNPRKQDWKGRPEKFTPKAKKIVISEIRKGNSYVGAARCARINYETLRKWMRWGEAGEEGYVDFLIDLRQAEGELEGQYSEGVDEASQKGIWQAGAWKLERRWPDRWGKREPKEEAQAVNKIEVVIEGLERKGKDDDK